MGSIGSKGSWLWIFIVVIGCVVACAPKKALPATAPAASPEQLPEGPGHQILMSACVTCHGLREVTKFRGFYTRQQWRDVVLTMVEYGAPVSEKDAEVLTDYLTANLGKK